MNLGERSTMNSATHRRVGFFVVAFWMTFRPPIVASQLSGHGLSRATVDVPHYRSEQISHAIGSAADYLEQHCDGGGRFAYLVDTNSGEISPSYNIVRHAGAIYALGMLDAFHSDSSAENALVHAADFMRANYLAPEGRSHALAVWSGPAPANRLAELGAAGLGLVALTSVEQARPNAIPLAELQSLGKFVLFLQKSDGSFYSRYYADNGIDHDWQSLYYPGEAVLGLVSLYELDHSRKWLVAAGKGLAYLAESRAGLQEVPPDHWALIATAKFLRYYEQIECPVSRAELVQHAARICDRFFVSKSRAHRTPDLMVVLTLAVERLRPPFAWKVCLRRWSSCQRLIRTFARRSKRLYNAESSFFSMPR